MKAGIESGWWRSPGVGTATIVLALLLSGCGDDGSTPTSGGNVTTTMITPTSVATTSTSGAEYPEVAAAITAVGTRYRFTALVTVGGAENTRVEGVVYDGIGQYLVTTAGQTVEYIMGPAGQWARQGSGPWTVLAGPAPVVDPLGSLAHPVAVTVVSTQGATMLIDATYPGSALGFAGAGDVVVQMVIVDGAIAETRYAVPLSDQEAAVVTTIESDAAMTPVTIPGR